MSQVFDVLVDDRGAQLLQNVAGLHSVGLAAAGAAASAGVGDAGSVKTGSVILESLWL